MAGAYPIKSVEVRCWPGATRHAAMNEAVTMSRLINRSVRLIFNDQAIDLDATDPAGLAAAEWYPYA